jgi:hypothetical protein
MALRAFMGSAAADGAANIFESPFSAGVLRARAPPFEPQASPLLLSLFTGDYARAARTSMTDFPLSLHSIPRGRCAPKSYDLLAVPRAFDAP